MESADGQRSRVSEHSLPELVQQGADLFFTLAFNSVLIITSYSNLAYALFITELVVVAFSDL